jgi:hypothetical protein
MKDSSFKMQGKADRAGFVVSGLRDALFIGLR